MECFKGGHKSEGKGKEKVKKDIEYTKLNDHDDEVVVYVCLRGGVCVVVKRFLVKKGNWIFFLNFNSFILSLFFVFPVNLLLWVLEREVMAETKVSDRR